MTDYINRIMNHPSVQQLQNRTQQHHQQQPPQSYSKPSTQSPATFTIKSSWRDPDLHVVYPINSQSQAPLFSFTHAKHAKPNVTFYSGEPEYHNKIGSVTLHSMSSKSEIVHRNHEFQMKTSSLSGNHTILQNPVLRNVKWHPSKLSGSSAELKDESSGAVLATIKSKTKEKTMEILVQGDQTFVELVLLTGMAGRFQQDKEIETAMKASKFGSAVGSAAG